MPDLAKDFDFSGWYWNTEIEGYADRLHVLLCTWNHTDGCGYHYDNWNPPMREFSPRKRYLDLALRYESMGIPAEPVLEVLLPANPKGHGGR